MPSEGGAGPTPTTAEVEFIYTYEHKEQEIGSSTVNLAQFNAEGSVVYFLNTALGGFTREDAQGLVKISACVMGDVSTPDWYTACNGKFYFKPELSGDHVWVRACAAFIEGWIARKFPQQM